MNGAAASDRLTTAHSWVPAVPLWNVTGDGTVVPAGGLVEGTSDKSVPAEPTPPGKCQKRTIVSYALMPVSLWMWALSG
ncbi:MAG: hypothetical protein ACXVRM_10780 [Solirubrobacteraceae bacterium]